MPEVAFPVDMEVENVDLWFGDGDGFVLYVGSEGDRRCRGSIEALFVVRKLSVNLLRKLGFLDGRPRESSCKVAATLCRLGLLLLFGIVSSTSRYLPVECDLFSGAEDIGMLFVREYVGFDDAGASAARGATATAAYVCPYGGSSTSVDPAMLVTREDDGRRDLPDLPDFFECRLSCDLRSDMKWLSLSIECKLRVFFALAGSGDVWKEDGPAGVG